MHRTAKGEERTLASNILITGGLGFIGSHITEALACRPDYKVVVYDLGATNRGSPKAATVHGDIFDSDKLLKVIRGSQVSSIIHMVGLASIPTCRENPDLSFRLNVMSVQRLLEAMRQCDVERLVFPSTAAVYGAANGMRVEEAVSPRPNTVYGCHKLAAEMLIRGYVENYGLKSTVLRIFNVYGDLDKEQGVISLFVRKILAGEPLCVKGGGQLRDFIHVKDVVEAFVRSLHNGSCRGATLNVGSGVGVRVKEIAEMVQRAFPKVEVKYEPNEDSEYSIYADVSRMADLLGFTATHPKIGIPTFLDECRHRYLES
jgi:UDP-glucose 4-epimerase